MRIDRVQSYTSIAKSYQNNADKNVLTKNITSPVQNQEYAKVPAGFRYGANINFTGTQKQWVVNVPLIEFENYKAMPNARKERFRMLYRDFDKLIDDSQRQVLLSIDKHPENIRIPLQQESEMDNFIKVAQMYSKFKEHPIICLGRSPKWFLNASLWMKDGIPDYKFVAFSSRWYWIYDGDFRMNDGLVRMERFAPTASQEKAYRRYLKRIQADPASIVERTQKAGQKTIITDYVDSGKGFTSFLEVMGNYAKDQGVLDEFGHSIDILKIGNKEYRQIRKKMEYIPSDPHVFMPEIMNKFDIPTTAWGTGQIIEQKYFDVDYDVFKQMLINQNPNECRSTYFSPNTWTIYNPDKFKTGMVKDMKKIKELVKMLKSEKPVYIFDPVMSAYRNLLNFRILDGLDARGLLKAVHRTKI